MGEMPMPNEMAELSLPIVGSQLGGDGSSASSATHFASGDTSTTDGISPGSRDETTGTTLPPATREDVHQPFIMSEGLAPVPVKLVANILRGEFIDLAELLRDNVEALRRGTLQNPMAGDAPPAKCLRREIPDLLSWMQCFGTFMVVIASKRPDTLRQLLAYQTTIVREVRRYGGNGWLSYYTMFRQQVARDNKADWSKLNSSLYGVSFWPSPEKGGAEHCVWRLTMRRRTVPWRVPTRTTTN